MFFDMKTLQEQSKNSPQLMLKMLENFYYKRIPKNKADKANFCAKSIIGDNFILCPERLFSAQVDVNYKVQYLILAAKRDYMFYKIYAVTYLDLSYFPDLDIGKIRGNPLMEVINNKLYFKLEGNTNG
jgi:hypothetical protein